MIKVDRIGQKWNEVDQNEQNEPKWTKVDHIEPNGQNWTKVD